MKSICRVIICILFLGLALNLCSYAAEKKKKILYVDSYNANIWSATIESGIHSILDKQNDIELKIFRMDTKRNPSIEYKKKSALKAKAMIEEWKPDVVIASDDNSAKYLIAPYFIDSDIPFVFCGINYDASEYGFPAKNITGIIEVVLIDESLKLIKEYSKGDKLGFLAADNLTSHRTYDYITKNENVIISEVRFVKNFTELKEAFIEIQKKVDMVFFYDLAAVKNFNHDEMIDFSKKNTVIPTFGSNILAIKYSLLGTPKMGSELGMWAAMRALDILNGKSPQDIPITKNKLATLYLNLPIARKLGVKFPIDLLDSSHLIYDKDMRVLFLDFYNHKCQPNKEIESGILLSLNLTRITRTQFNNTESEVDFKVLHTPVDNESGVEELSRVSEQILQKIESFKPDVIIAMNSDITQDLIRSEYIAPNTPFIICEQDSDLLLFRDNKYANIYHSEKDLSQILDLAKNYAKGNKLGYIGTDTLLLDESINKLEAELNTKFSSGYSVSSFEEFKDKFRKLQDEVDLICIFEICSIVDPADYEEAQSFFLANTKIPTIGFEKNQNSNSLFSLNQLAFKQGLIAGQAALHIIKGDNLKEIQNLDDFTPKSHINNSILDRIRALE